MISARRLLLELIIDLFDYYINPYPILLIIGFFRRLRQRIKSIWLPKPKGRPPISNEVVDLILSMKRNNWGWGGQRISDELKLLGILVSKKTVLKILRENGLIPPKTRFTPPSWKALLESHKNVWGCDFTTIFDSRGTQIWIFNVIDCSTRRLIVSAATTNPTSTWLIQQIRNCAIETCDQLPEALIHDRDGIFGKWFDRLLVEEFGVKPIRTPYKSPWCNGHCERFHFSLKSEVLSRVPIESVSHVTRLCTEYKDYYNYHRPHQGISGRQPNRKNKPKLVEGSQIPSIKVRREVSGLITRFAVAA